MKPWPKDCREIRIFRAPATYLYVKLRDYSSNDVCAGHVTKSGTLFTTPEHTAKLEVG